jgi:hypothetical protein
MRKRVPFLIAATLVVLAACASKERVAGDSGAAQAGQADLSPNVVTVHAKDFAFDMPGEIPSGVTTFQFVNDGPNFHHMQIVRLDSGKTFADFDNAMKAKAPPPGWMVFVGGPNAPDPGSQSNATMDMTPGEYAVLCFVDIPGRVPHFTKGMVHALSVKPAAGPTASTPAADIAITLVDYGFTLSAPFTAGKHTISLVNDAMQDHEIEIVRLAPGKTAKDFLDWADKLQGPPPGSGIGGVAGLAHGLTASFNIDLTPGDYLLVCFAPDAKDGKPHFLHGMMHVEKVS